MKKLVSLFVVLVAGSAAPAVVSLDGPSEVWVGPSDELLITCSSDIGLLQLDAILDVVGPATIVGAMSRADAASYGWDPATSFDPILGPKSTEIGGANFLGNASNPVGYWLLRCDDYGDAVVTLRDGAQYSGTLDIELRPSDFVGSITIHQIPPATVTLVPIEEGQPGSPTNPLRPGDEITIGVTSDGVLVQLEARLDVTSGPGTIVGAINTSDCADYRWDPGSSLDPTIEGTYAEIGELASFVGAGPGTVGYFTLRCDAEGVVVVDLGQGWSHPPPEPPYYVYGRLEIYVTATYYVNAADGNDLNNGRAPETAFATIQKGIDEANDGNTVIVAPGTYTGAGNRDITFRGKAIAVQSTNPCDPNIVATTIIDCNGSESNPHRGFKFHSAEGPNSVLSGLTITGGYGHEEDIGETYRRSAGGGILCKNAGPTLTYCRIVGNRVGHNGRGAGICCLSGDLSVSHTTVSNNTGGSRGAGIYCAQGQQVISNCVFSGNRTSFGAAIYCYTGSNAAIDHCTITANTAGYDGGGICCGSGGRPTITNSIIWGNAANRYSPEITCGSASFCDIRGGRSGTGNIDADPCFADYVGGDYHLLENSPCINSGDPNHTGDPCATDIDGEPRVINNRLDIGADEVSYIGPLIRIEPAEFVFEAAEGGSNPGTDVLLVKNAGTGTLYWEITQGCPWLEVYPTAGELTNDTAIVSLYVNISGLTIGSYNGELTVSSSNAANSPQTVAVTLHIYDADPLHVPSEYPTIQEAIDWAFEGATVVVAPGTYTGAGNKNLDFRGKAITVRSTDPSDPCVVAATVIDCQGSGRGFYFRNGEDANSILAGFTITRGNVQNKGGGVYCSGASPTIENCIIVSNDSRDLYGHAYGGGICCSSNSSPIIAGCTIKDNKAQGGHGVDFGVDGGDAYGGGVYASTDSHPTIQNCRILDNTASGGLGFGGMDPVYDGDAYGGGIYGDVTINDCMISGNIATSGYSEYLIPGSAYGGAMYCLGPASIENCTIVNNSAIDHWDPWGLPGEPVAFGGGVEGTDETTITNCIFWDNTASTEGPQIHGGCLVLYSDVQGGYAGEGNINADPLFVDPDDDDYHLGVGSPCIDAGDNSAVPPSVVTDLDGNPRIVGPAVDMGAYEFQGLYVDDDAPNDPGPDDPCVSDPLENGTESHPFDSIQEAIDMAQAGHTVLVYPGVYTEEVDFSGKAITVQSIDEPAVLRAPGSFAVWFYHEEDANSVLKNFIIRNSYAGLLFVGSSPTVSNVTVVANAGGAMAIEGANPNISNSIFWNNWGADLSDCEARYSRYGESDGSDGSIDADPCFADPCSGDYRLKSEGWRWSADQQQWVFDDVTSPCIDAGNPGTSLRNEPMSVPNDPDNVRGVNVRVNMGAYGGTSQAGIAPHGWALLADLNNDRHLNWFDLAAQLEDWLQYANEQPGDLNRDGVVNGEDSALLCGEWTDAGEGMGTVDFRYYWLFGVGNLWDSELVPDAGFTLEITDQFFVNGFEIWEFTNEYGTIWGGYTLTLYYVYVNGMLYATENLSDLDSLPEVSEGLQPQYPQIVQLGRPIYIPDVGRMAPWCRNVMAVRGTLSDVLKSTSFTVEDFPLGDQDDVIAFLGPNEYCLTVFARGLGPMRLYEHFIVEAIVP